ncbi:galactoside 3(4)-L-fucosyltransferase-like [Brachionus plicatilis]|uniref:Fucosyltransferase n=1 Tax=Brachionus plicatilis TaxID=10195 RepID=A0A3M7RED3_BRAPC|nr:galactoside 3(4)-L-fucosyltransferase-like [Brachionus plicatilis]
MYVCKNSANKKVPKSGFIDVLDFKNPKDLAEYLIYLDKNNTAYNSYFKWKKYMKPIRSIMSTICDMCVQMKLDTFFPVKTTIIDNVEKFWSKKKSCKLPGFDESKNFYLQDYDDNTRAKIVSQEKNILKSLNANTNNTKN